MNSAMPPLYLNSALLRLAGLWIGGALVGQRDQQALVQEGQLAQTLRQRVVVVLGNSEDLLVGNEVDLGAALLGRAGLLQLGGRLALGIALLPHRAVAPDLKLELMAQRVHAGDANAVQSAGNFVGRAVELSARVQHGHHDLRRRHSLAVHVHLVDRNAAAVVDDGDGVVDVDGDVDAIGKSGQRFVNRVVHDFVDEVMQSHLAGRADVHRGTLAHRFHAAENFDGIGGVLAVRLTVAVLPSAGRLLADVLELACCCPGPPQRLTGNLSRASCSILKQPVSWPDCCFAPGSSPRRGEPAYIAYLPAISVS